MVRARKPRTAPNARKSLTAGEKRKKKTMPSRGEMYHLTATCSRMEIEWKRCDSEYTFEFCFASGAIRGAIQSQVLMTFDAVLFSLM